MRIVYYDEAGDDGYPKFSSPLFALSALYLHHLNWKDVFAAVLDFRRHLKATYGLPVKLEMHSKYFLLNKNPYRTFGFSDSDRLSMFEDFCRLIGALDCKLINVVIVKPRITNPGYPVLDTALKYSVQRIENDLNLRSNPDEKFLIITDEGRVGKMRQTTRRIQRYNYIPSRFASGAYRKEISALIEDPLPKNSRESYFVQLSDVVAQVVYYYALLNEAKVPLPNRMASLLNLTTLEKWLDLLEPSLNLAAAPGEPYGIKYHPK